jgi:hypothetical protein
MATEKIKEYAKQVFPHLVHQAKLRSTIEYGDLALRAGLPHHRPLNHVLGYIRDESP